MKVSEWLPVTSTVLAFVLMVSVSAGASDGILLKKEVTVDYPPLTLSNVAVDGTVPSEFSLNLGKLPQPGETRIMSQAYIGMIARKKNKPRPNFQDEPVRVRVKRSERTLTEDVLRDRIKKLLEKKLVLGNNGSIEVTKVPEELSIVPGPYKLKSASRNQYQKQRGDIWYRFKVVQKGHEIDSFRARVRISQYDKVPFATRPLRRGTIIQPNMVNWKEADIGETRGGFVGEPKDLIGMELTRSLSPGDKIKDRHVKRPIIIDRGDNVTIRYKLGNMTVTAKGEARDDGAMGERIEVENKSSERVISAKVISENLVEVLRNSTKNG